MKIYTKTGDDGTTGLFSGARVSKASLRVETYGTTDELNTIIGIAVSHIKDSQLKDDLLHLNNLLFVVGSDLATPIVPKPKFEIKRISSENIEWLEEKIDNYTIQMPVLKNFILPGGSIPAAHLHHARTVCRRAERLCVRLASEEDLGEHLTKFLNRLSDYLFTAARKANFDENISDVMWQK
jgi:cob(I)alamin adenosyltransferase